MGNLKRSRHRRKRGASNLPLFLLAGLAALAAEWLIFALLWEYEPDHTVGVTYSVLTCSFSLLGLVASRAAGLLKADPRADIADKAFMARTVSIALLLPTVFIGAGAMAQKIEDRASIEYARSAEYVGDLQHSKGRDEYGAELDSRVVAEATANLSKAIRPTQARMADPAYFGAVLAFLAMMLLPSLAVGHGLTFAAETPAQEKNRLADAAAKAETDRKADITAKGQATKAKNLALKNAGFTPAGTGKLFQLWRNVS